MAAMSPLRVPCPACGEEIELPARLCVGYDDKAHVLVDLNPSREHAAEHKDVLLAALATFGIPW